METEEAIRILIREKLAQLSPEEIKLMAEGVLYVKAKHEREKKEKMEKQE